MSWRRYQGISVPAPDTTGVKRSYSVTADVLSYRRCGRLYGFQAERGFVPSQPTQRFVGTVIHQVLDRAHSHFMGRLDPSTQGTVPTDQDIGDYFNEVENALRARGIRPIGPIVRARSLEIVQAFNRVEGPVLYPLVRDTEHRLQTDEPDYLLHGVVDVLASSPESTDPDDVQIWDYKGSKSPNVNTQDGRARLRDYQFQMLVYADLYLRRNGRYPKKAFIYFVGEFSRKPVPDVRPQNAVMGVELEPEDMQTALAEFDNTVHQIEDSRLQNRWVAPQDGAKVAGQETCDLCDIRWTCPEMGPTYRQAPAKYP